MHQNYLVRLVSTQDLSPESSFWVYLNNVGIMHTGKPGFKHREKKPELRVEYIHSEYCFLSQLKLSSHTNTGHSGSFVGICH